MGWHDWDLFCRVVEYGGFTAAARALGQPKSSLSAAVKRLEGELGQRLLERTTRRLRLTEAGDAAYNRASPLFVGLRAARDEALASRHEVAGTLRIASPYEFGAHHVGPVACALMAQHPALRIQIDVEHAFVNPLAEPYDLVFATLESRPPPSAAVIRRVFSLERGLFAAPSLLKQLGEPRRPAELAKLPLLASPAESFWSFTDRQGASPERVPVLSPKLLSSNADVRLQAALAGQGVMRVTATYCHAAIAAGTLRRLLPDHVAEPLHVYALLPARRLMPEKVRRFLDVLIAHAQALADVTTGETDRPF